MKTNTRKSLIIISLLYFPPQTLITPNSVVVTMAEKGGTNIRAIVTIFNITFSVLLSGYVEDYRNNIHWIKNKWRKKWKYVLLSVFIVMSIINVILLWLHILIYNLSWLLIIFAILSLYILFPLLMHRMWQITEKFYPSKIGFNESNLFFKYGEQNNIEKIYWKNIKDIKKIKTDGSAKVWAIITKKNKLKYIERGVDKENIQRIVENFKKYYKVKNDRV